MRKHIDGYYDWQYELYCKIVINKEKFDTHSLVIESLYNKICLEEICSKQEMTSIEKKILEVVWSKNIV